MPTVLRVVGEAVDAVEVLGGPGTGAAKKQAVMEAVEAAYDLAEGVQPGAFGGLSKSVFVSLASALVETSLGLHQARTQREHGEHADSMAPLQ